VIDDRTEEVVPLDLSAAVTAATVAPHAG
jgi:hypothetical protein